MAEIENHSIAITVTSPPIWNAIDDDIHDQNFEEHYRAQTFSIRYSDSPSDLDWLEVVGY